VYVRMAAAASTGLDLLACCPEAGVLLASAATILLLAATLELGRPRVGISLGCVLLLLRFSLAWLLDI